MPDPARVKHFEEVGLPVVKWRVEHDHYRNVWRDDALIWMAEKEAAAQGAKDEEARRGVAASLGEAEKARVIAGWATFIALVSLGWQIFQTFWKPG